MRTDLRIFISSPGDVQEERLRAHLVVQKLARDYQRFFRITPYLWEYEPMLASGHFQDAIEPPSHSDIVVLVVYSRLGTPLPERTAARDYRGIDGRSPVTGTEWEFEEALEAHRSRGAPDLLAYRKLGDPQASLADTARRAEQERQWNALESFWQRHFEGGGVFLAGSSKFKALEEFDAKLEADLVRLIEARIAADLRAGTGGGEEATWLHGSPFPGLAAYDFDDAPVFFGRDAQIREASTRLQAAAGEGTAFLLMLGASGSGKSSLARAGVLPALFAAKAVPGVGLWRRAVLRPAEGGEDPVLGLAKALVAGDPAKGEGLPELLASGMGPDALAAHLRSAPDDPSFPFRQALAGLASEARAKLGLLPHEQARLVILVDQVEELFTREVDPPSRALFVRILAGLARSGVVWVVATMRNDLWHRAAEIPDLVRLVETGARLDVPAPGGAEIIEIVRRPAAAAGLVFDKDPETGIGLDAVIARAASEEPGALPLLSVMMQSLFARDIAEHGGRALTFASYRALGELKGAIAQRADDALAELQRRDPEAAAALPRVLRALVTASGDGTATSRPALLDGFPAGSPDLRLVEAMLAARLLVASERDGGAELRLAHEALIENWPSARDQIATDRRDLQTRARLETLQRRWAEAAGPAERKTTLLTSLNLAEGVDLAHRWGIPATDGLGAYVAQSQAAERWRRRRVAVAASILVLVFAGIAALASLQWRRAEQQTLAARAAEETEREARAAADTARNEAVRERDRADAETARTLAALREAKRNTARTLATQAELAADRSEIHRSLALALEAGETETDVLAPGERSVGHPALLRALADEREILHLDRPKGQGHTLPHDFLGNDRLVYADEQAGILVADLATGAIRRLAALPEHTLPLNVRGVPSLDLVVVTSVKNVFVVEVATGTVRARIPFEERIGALDIDEAGHAAIVGTGAAVTFIDLDKPMAGPLVKVPAPRPDFLVGQVRAVPGSRKVLVGYGADILELDRATGAFATERPRELTAGNSGMGRDVVEAASAQAYMVFVEMRPDPVRDRVLMYSVLSLASVKPDGHRYDYERDTADSVLGLDFTAADNGGDAVAVMGKRVDAGIDMRIAFVSDEKKPLVMEAFRISASDLDNEQLQGCKLTRNLRLVACTYNGKTSQGLHVWHVLGGKHRGARVASAIDASVSGASLPGPVPRLLVASKSGLTVQPGARRLPATGWDETWRLEASDGPYLAAASAASGKVQVLRAVGDGLEPALPPLDGMSVAVRGDLDRALVLGADRLALHDLRTGRAVVTVPGLVGLKAAELRRDGSEILALTGDAAYLFDARTGRLLNSVPVATAPASPSAIDSEARRVAVVGPGGPQILDVASGTLQPLGSGPWKDPVDALAIDASSDRIVVAQGDGRLAAFDLRGRAIWALASAADESFAENTYPGQKPRGSVLQLAVSPGHRLAIVRQDVMSVDLHDLSSGQFLTQLTPPWMSGIPARVAFDAEDGLVTAWALHALSRATPSAVSLHRLPLAREASLAAVRATLAATSPRRPDGSLRPADPARSE